MPATTIPLTIEQGATFFFDYTWRADSVSEPGTPGDPIDLTGASARLHIRKRQGDPVLVEAYSSGINSYITLGGAAGTVSMTLPADATNLLTSKTCLYDMEVELPDGKVFRPVEGPVTVKPNITQVPSDPEVE